MFGFGGDLEGWGTFAEGGCECCEDFALGGWVVVVGEVLVEEGLDSGFGGRVLWVDEAEDGDFGHAGGGVWIRLSYLGERDEKVEIIPKE